ncbi:hypothetical protein N9S22_03595 [Paracoccaceae bacterium]|nr:hypothetical protein [Paracoccaceae bacterium]
MKKVLLTTTAMAFATSMASAGDMAMSGAIKLTYGSFGTGSAAATGGESFTSEADLDIAATSAGGNISMTGTLELDESGEAAGPVTISTGSLTFTYDANDLGALARTNPADGEDDNYGDYSVAFAAGGISVSYTKDQESSDNAMSVAYAPGGALSLSLSTVDETRANASTGTLVSAAAAKTTVGATYVTGPYTIALSGNDATVQEWDASVAMVSGDTTVTVSSDEKEEMKVKIGYTSGGMTASASQEFNNDDETEISLSYTDGALTFGAAHDSGQGKTAHYGDEAQMVVSASYVDGDVTVAAKGTDQDEMEVSVTFAF